MYSCYVYTFFMTQHLNFEAKFLKVIIYLVYIRVTLHVIKHIEITAIKVIT